MIIFLFPTKHFRYDWIMNQLDGIWLWSRTKYWYKMTLVSFLKSIFSLDINWHRFEIVSETKFLNRNFKHDMKTLVEKRPFDGPFRSDIKMYRTNHWSWKGTRNCLDLRVFQLPITDNTIVISLLISHCWKLRKQVDYNKEGGNSEYDCTNKFYRKNFAQQPYVCLFIFPCCYAAGANKTEMLFSIILELPQRLQSENFFQKLPVWVFITKFIAVLCSTQKATGTDTDWNKLRFVFSGSVQRQAKHRENDKTGYKKPEEKHKPPWMIHLFRVFVFVAVRLNFPLLAFIWEMIFANRRTKWLPEAYGVKTNIDEPSDC